MNVDRLVETHGDPLGTVRSVLKWLWDVNELDYLLATQDEGKGVDTPPHLMHDQGLLEDINPFKPLMLTNTARLVPEIVAGNPGKRIGALLRPCEMRALIEIQKKSAFPSDDLTTICVDCLGTLPLEDYNWRAERLGGGKSLSDEAIQFSRQGGILAYRYRSACQMCTSPGASGADLNINVIGLPARQKIILNYDPKNQRLSQSINEISSAPADEPLVTQHNQVLYKLTERHRHTMERLFDTLAEYLPKDVDAIISQLEGCQECRVCMDVCPTCSIERPGKDQDGHYARREVVSWLVSCSGCGMCEQYCPDHLPLSSIFGYVREQLQQEFGYIPGQATDNPLPLM